MKKRKNTWENTVQQGVSAWERQEGAPDQQSLIPTSLHCVPPPPGHGPPQIMPYPPLEITPLPTSIPGLAAFLARTQRTATPSPVSLPPLSIPGCPPSPPPRR